MSQKMTIFPKKALKMPGWQHCDPNRNRPFSGFPFQLLSFAYFGTIDLLGKF